MPAGNHRRVFICAGASKGLSHAGQPGGRTCNRRKAAGEESPGSTETRCRVTPGGGDPRESATESKPPRHPTCRDGGRWGGGARVKGWGKSPPRTQQCGRHGKPHREQNRIGMARRKPGRFPAPVIRVGCVRRPATGVQDEWPPRFCPKGQGPYKTRLTGRLTLSSLFAPRDPARCGFLFAPRDPARCGFLFAPRDPARCGDTLPSAAAFKP